jgi:hypothetical protein
MKRQTAERLAMQEFRRLVLDDMGLFMIAEAWGIEPFAGGCLSQGYVLEEMTKQILEMDIEEEEAADTQHSDDTDDLLCMQQGALG